MKKTLVKTSNYEKFRIGIAAVEQRGAPEASWMLVSGDPGFGKSLVVDRWAVEQKAVYLRAKVEWTPRYLMSELAQQLKIDMSGRAKEIFGRIVGMIGGQQVPIVIDEVQHTLANGAKVLEAVRDISDLTESLVILVAGVEQVQTRIARYPQISSRIAAVIDFQAASFEDVEKCCRELAEVKIAKDLTEEIFRQCGGRLRDVLNAIARIERDAKRNGKHEAKLADFTGQVLIPDWQTRRPRVVKAAAGER